MREFLENKNMTLIYRIQQKCQDLNTCQCPRTQNEKGKHEIQVKDIEDQSNVFNDLINKSYQTREQSNWWTKILSKE